MRAFAERRPAVGSTGPASRAPIQRKCGGKCAKPGAKPCSGCAEGLHAAHFGEHASDPRQLVDRAVASAGEPLPGHIRADLEPRFEHDFSRVRVHSSGDAHASSRAIGAGAYTVGNDIVFAEGRYQPYTSDGRRLLAHELTHVVQQDRAASTGVQGHGISNPGDASEREAGAIADAVAAGRERVAPTAHPTAHVQTGDRDPGTPPPPAPEPSEPAPAHTCGPDVTAHIEAAVSRTGSTFDGWTAAERETHCDALDSFDTGAYAWDIVELHNNAWILDYRPACASQGATPPCGSSVQVGTECYYAGSPNYVIYGKMCRLCHDHYSATGNTDGVERFTESEMVSWINFYKGTGWSGLGTPSGNFIPSRDWASAGFAGWPSGGTAPGGDRSNCTPNCPTPFSGSFTVHWYPDLI